MLPETDVTFDGDTATVTAILVLPPNDEPLQGKSRLRHRYEYRPARAKSFGLRRHPLSLEAGKVGKRGRWAIDARHT